MRETQTAICGKLKPALIATARGELMDPRDRAGVYAHAAHCVRCREELTRQRSLSACLAEVARQTPPIPDASATLIHAVRARRRRRMGIGAALALVGAAAALTAVMLSPAQHRDRPVPSPAAAVTTRAFIPLPFARPFSRAEQVGLYRVQMPEAALSSFGLPINGQLADREVTAEVLVGEDGVARAIRFVHTEDTP